MIFFACKQCGKRFERPDQASGTLVFCSCGAGTHVPWESTLPPEEVPQVNRPAPRWAETGAEPERQPPRVLPRNPDNCLNHADTPKEHLCADCKEPFCAGCLVAFQGETVCGPCKNFRLRRLQRPSNISIMAILATLLSLGTGAVWLFVLLAAAGSKAQAPAIITLGVVGLVPQLAALVMAGLALRAVETDSRVSGRSWAITGLVGVLVSSVLTGQMVLLVLQIAD